jgi:hypothetical protein
VRNYHETGRLISEHMLLKEGADDGAKVDPNLRTAGGQK